MALQNIDTQALGQLISAFRALQTKDSITPESLGSLLQSIASLVATAPTLASAQQLDSWASALMGAKTALHAVAQGAPDRNDLNINISNVSLVNGSTTPVSVPVVIKQATTDRAGAMRASHVSDLYAATRNVTALQEAMAAANLAIAEIESRIGFSGFVKTRFSLTVEDKMLRISGVDALLKAGYVPYIFRNIKKRNRYRLAGKTPQEIFEHGRPPVRKGWSLYGSMYSLKIDSGVVLFSTADPKLHSRSDMPTGEFSHKPQTLLVKSVDADGHEYFNWGHKKIPMTGYNNKGVIRKRNLRFRFAIGFAPPIKPGRRRITTADLVSELVEFKVNFMFVEGGIWAFGHA